MRASLFLISLALSSAACSDATEFAEDAGVKKEAVSTPETAQAKAAAGGANAISKETEQYQFAYAWPEEAGRHDKLAAFLQEDADHMQGELAKEAAEDWKGAEGQDWTPRQHSASLEWKVVTDTPRFLSLSGHLATYSGGAHGMYGVESLVWDKKADDGMDAKVLFQSPIRLETALGAELCAKLNKEREKRRGIKVDPNSGDSFDNCPGLDEATVLVGSSTGKTLDRLTIYFGPYVAGPYAEGDFELDFPVTAAVLDAVKPEYASGFSIKR
ncbi:DUF3298 and DUF4163 domain-containing protein [Qipengyuania soli]|uniref:DUF3298 and DUF4163 domain-containing protein n=1 Tax=Qipengyuania soli TaxID=2782568 RepID=A0A7S8IVY7_9SPHN|nr:DUF3298 and DUF4163 domain-containing protein [Qipengyuania soli]QPC99376.1 DUF3298 and DUF4163 domain-containing protein [Qipengyuania soli]